MLYTTKIHTIIGRLVAIILYTIAFCLGGELCDDNPDICDTVLGCYSDRNAESGQCNMSWWAYVPKGKLACPEEGCPLYIWMDGTIDANKIQLQDEIFKASSFAMFSLLICTDSIMLCL